MRKLAKYCQKQLFQNAENEPKACSNLRQVYLVKTPESQED